MGKLVSRLHGKTGIQGLVLEVLARSWHLKFPFPRHSDFNEKAIEYVKSDLNQT